MKKLIGVLFMLALFHTPPLIAYKLVSLNIWGGYIREPLLDFIKSHQEIDFFCLQEVYHNAPHKISTDDKEVTLDIFSKLQEQLPNHNGYFLPVVKGIYGIAMFVRKDIERFLMEKYAFMKIKVMWGKALPIEEASSGLSATTMETSSTF